MKRFGGETILQFFEYDDQCANNLVLESTISSVCVCVFEQTKEKCQGIMNIGKCSLTSLRADFISKTFVIKIIT